MDSARYPLGVMQSSTRLASLTPGSSICGRLWSVPRTPGENFCGFIDPKACIFSRALPPFSHGAGIAYTQRKGDFRTGEAVMAKVLNDILLFSCIAAFVTGIVLAAASLLT
jgi:hypothetical protein